MILCSQSTEWMYNFSWNFGKGCSPLVAPGTEKSYVWYNITYTVVTLAPRYYYYFFYCEYLLLIQVVVAVIIVAFNATISAVPIPTIAVILLLCYLFVGNYYRFRHPRNALFLRQETVHFNIDTIGVFRLWRPRGHNNF